MRIIHVSIFRTERVGTCRCVKSSSGISAAFSPLKNMWSVGDTLIRCGEQSMAVGVLAACTEVQFPLNRKRLQRHRTPRDVTASPTASHPGTRFRQQKNPNRGRHATPAAAAATAAACDSLLASARTHRRPETTHACCRTSIKRNGRGSPAVRSSSRELRCELG